MISFYGARVLRGIILTLALLFSPLPAKAELNDGAANGEDVAIAFFKTAGENPDFELWAKKTTDYRRAAPARAQGVLDKEKQRLMTRWREYNSDEDTLNVRGHVAVELKSTMDENDAQHYWMYIKFKAGEITYFPFRYQDYKFAVIPQQIETMMIQKITLEQFKLIRTDFSDNLTGSAYLYLQLKPFKAYMQQPYRIDDLDQWALLCDIASLSLVSLQKTGTMWTYAADWYVSPTTEKLRDLYQGATE